MFKLSAVVTPTKLDNIFEEFKRGLKLCATLKLNGIELSIPNPWRINGKSLKNLIKSYELEISAISTGLGNVWYGWSLSSKDVRLREKAISAIKKHIEEATHLNAPLIIGLIRGVGEEPLSNALKMFEESLVKCVEYAEDHGITLLLEPINRYETRLINTVREAKEIIERVSSKNLKLMVDTYHMNIEESNMGASVINVKDLLAYIHVADSNRLAPGRGHINFKDFLALLNALDYSNYLSLEIIPLPSFEEAVKTGVTYLRTIIELLE